MESKPKFKVGDRVLIRSPKTNGLQDFAWVDDMNKYDNTTQTVTHVNSGGWLILDTDYNWGFHQQWLSPAGELAEILYCD